MSKVESKIDGQSVVGAPVWPDPAGRMNDAHLFGEDSPEWQSLLQTDTTFMLGDNAKCRKWEARTAPLSNWLDNGAGEGLTFHPEAPRKDGKAIVFGSGGSKRNDRTAKSIVRVSALALDVDCGNALDAVEKRLLNLGVAAILYSSFSDGTTESDIDRDSVVKALGLEAPADEHVRTYLREHLGQYRTPEHIASVRVVDFKRHTDKGVRIVYAHDPLEKFRIVFPLAEPTFIADIAATHRAGLDLYADKIIGLARDICDVHPDASCTDPSRLFYLPRHPAGRDPYVSVLRGRPLTFAEIPAQSKQDYLASLKPVRRADIKSTTPGGMDLKRWAAQGYAVRFLAADAADALAPDRIRGGSGDKRTMECPFDDHHSNVGDPDDSACWIANGDGEAGFQWGCHHQSCQSYDRLDRLAKALAEGWFGDSESFLTADVSEYLLPAPDELPNDAPTDASPTDWNARFEDRAAWLPKAYITKGDTIYRRGDDQEADRPVCQAFDVVGRSSDEGGSGGAGRIISFVNENDETVERTLDRGDLAKDNGGEVIDTLARYGMRFADHGTAWRRDFLRLLATIAPERLVRTKSRPGWVRVKTGEVQGYMTPCGEYIHAGRGEPVMRLHEDATVEKRDLVGTLARWRVAASAAEACALPTSEEADDSNFYWLFGLAAGFAGPVMGLAETEACGFNLSGASSKGKTWAQRLAASVWGNPSKGGLLFPMNTTTNAVEDLATIASEAVLCLDEIGNMPRPQDLSALLFGMSGGTGKARKRGRGAGLAQTAEFQTFVILSNEFGLRATVEGASKPGSYKTGLAVRFPDVDASGGRAQPAEVIESLKAVNRNHGHAGPAFVRHLITSGWIDRGDELGAEIGKSAADIARANGSAPSALVRAARVFALVQVAGELAVDAGLLSDKALIARVVAEAFRRFAESDDGRVTHGGSDVLDGFKSYCVRNMPGTIIPADEADEPHHGGIVGWYTDDLIILDKNAVSDLSRLGLSGKLVALLEALKGEAALEMNGRNRAWNTLPAEVKGGTGERRVACYRISRSALGI